MSEGVNSFPNAPTEGCVHSQRTQCHSPSAQSLVLVKIGSESLLSGHSLPSLGV
jgi:hypothetical protein